MGRKPKLTDEQYLDVIDRFEMIDKIRTDIFKTYDKIGDLKHRAKLARDSIVTLKKEMTEEFGVSISCIELIGNAATRRSRALKIKREKEELEVGIDPHR